MLLLEAFGEDWFFASSSFGQLLASLACGRSTLTSVSVFPSSVLVGVCVSPCVFQKDTCQWIQANLGNLEQSCLKTHNFIASAKPLFPHKVTLPGSRE